LFALAALIGASGFVVAAAEAVSTQSQSSAVASAVPPQPHAMLQLEPIAAQRLARVDTVGMSQIVYFFPHEPLTVREQAKIYAFPFAEDGKALRTAAPGCRLRVNGLVMNSDVETPWLRVRLADGRDGFLQANFVPISKLRAERAAARREAEAIAEATASTTDPVGAPLSFTPPPPEEAPVHEAPVNDMPVIDAPLGY
jgi:hypothetical protein